VAEEIFYQLEKERGQVRFVQVGANDGVRGDLLHPLPKKTTWSGILIEPVPDALRRLREECNGFDGLIFEQIAIWPDDRPPTFWHVRGEDVLSSFSRETIRLHTDKYEDLEGMTEPLDVSVSRLDALCEKYAIEPDLIAVDVEGMDDVVLSTMNLEERPAPVLLFEHVALSREASTRLKWRLEASGYKLIHDRHDCLCIQSPPIDPHIVELCQQMVCAARGD
jgi:FkbM family methyltransferase